MIGEKLKGRLTLAKIQEVKVTFSDCGNVIFKIKLHNCKKTEKQILHHDDVDRACEDFEKAYVEKCGGKK